MHNDSTKYSTAVIQDLVNNGLRDKDILLTIMSILDTEEDCKKYLEWLNTLKVKPSIEKLIDKAEEIVDYRGMEI